MSRRPAYKFWSPAERLLHRIEVAEPTGCWLWQGAKDKDGYGVISVNDRSVRAHRLAYSEFVGAIGELPLDHLCRTPACVNPDHLEPVSVRENTMRGVGPSAANAQRTHCLRGHELTGDNIYSPPSSPEKRTCRQCRILRKRAWRARTGNNR